MKVRDSNFELLRIIAILMVLVLHANFFALEGPSVAQINNHTIESTIRIFIQSVCVIAVDVFVMISGWYGIRHSWTGLGNLIFQTLYYGCLLFAISLFINSGESILIGVRDIFLLSSSNWFIKAYLLLYLIAPMLNGFVENSTKKQLKYILIGFLTFQTLYGWIAASSTEYFCGGYSPLSFFGLYLLARYIRHYTPKWSQYSIKKDLFVILCIILGEVIMCIVPSMIFKNSNAVWGYNFYTYISPTTIIVSLYTIILFSKLNFENKSINRLALSSFAVYLVYVNPNALTPYKIFFFNLYQNHSYYEYWVLVFGIVIILYLLVTLLDSGRIILWYRLKTHINIYHYNN